MEDRRAHDRIDEIEVAMEKHRVEHARFEKSIAENTLLTQSIADNTQELVQLVKSAKGLRSFVVWAAPIAATAAATWAWMKGH